jgi:hypothetical protein
MVRCDGTSPRIKAQCGLAGNAVMEATVGLRENQRNEDNEVRMDTFGRQKADEANSRVGHRTSWWCCETAAWLFTVLAL